MLFTAFLLDIFLPVNLHANTPKQSEDYATQGNVLIKPLKIVLNMSLRNGVGKERHHSSIGEKHGIKVLVCQFVEEVLRPGPWRLEATPPKYQLRGLELG